MFPTALRSARTTRWLFAFSALLFVAGVVAILVLLFRNNGSTASDQPAPSNGSPQTVAKEKSVPLSAEAQRTAASFILTAVPRKHLGEAWKISGAAVRGGLTRKEFLTGNIAVVPVPGKIVQVKYKTAYSYSDNALLRVTVAVKHGKNQVFFLGLRRHGNGAAARWLVDSWEPYVPIPVRATP